jgi:hypothetical protein
VALADHVANLVGAVLNALLRHHLANRIGNHLRAALADVVRARNLLLAAFRNPAAIGLRAAAAIA